MPKPLLRYAVPPRTRPSARSAQDKKTIILDLDSTLIYTYLERPEACNRDEDYWYLDEVVEADGSVTPYYVLIRPYAKTFLQRCMAHYNIVFFTAAEREYAEPIFEHLCPEVGPEHRYYRDSCVAVNNGLTKDLSRLPSLRFDACRFFLFDDSAPGNTIPRENGMFCSEFLPDCDRDGSRSAIESLLEDNALEAFADLFCSERFLNAEDIRVPIAEYERLLNQQLGDSFEQ